MPLSASLKYTFRQLLEYEAEKPDLPEGYDNDAWDAAWQEAIVYALTTAPANVDDEKLNKFHVSLRDVISAIHRYMNPYIFNKIRLRDSDLPPVGCKDPDSYFPLVQEVHDYLFEWLAKDLSAENKMRIGTPPELPPHFSNLRVHQLPSAERLIYNGLNQGQYKPLSILLEAFEAFYSNENMSLAYRCCSIEELETLGHLLEQNGVFSEEEEEALADFFSITSSMDENTDAFYENLRNFKADLREELLQYKNRVQADLNQFPTSLKNNTLTDIALIRSASHEQLLEFYKQKDLWSATRLGAMLSMIPPAGWKVFLDTGLQSFLVSYRLIPRRPDCCFDAFIHLPVGDWPALLALPNVKNLLKAGITNAYHFVTAINKIPIPKRWDFLLLTEVQSSLGNIYHERTFDWFVENLLLNLPIDRRTEAVFLPALVEGYGKYISTKSGLKKLLEHVGPFRMQEFIELPGISLKIAQFIPLDPHRTIMAVIPEALRSNLYLIPVISNVLCDRATFYGMKKIIKVIPKEKRVQFVYQSHVKIKLSVLIVSGLMLSQILFTLPESEWDKFMGQLYIASKPAGMLRSALRMTKSHQNLNPQKSEDERYADKMRLIAEEFIIDESGKFITSPYDIPGIHGLIYFIGILPLQYWPKLLLVQGMKDRLVKEIATISNLTEYLKHMPDEKRWSFLALDLNIKVLIVNAVKEDCDEGRELLSILNPDVGDAEARISFLNLLKQIDCVSEIKREKKFSFFDSSYESPLKKVYDGLERSLNKSRASVTYK